jgi:hypothetical protein
MSVEARRFAIEAVHALVKSMRTETGTTRIAAARELLDRAFGKAQATVDMTVTKQIGQMNLAELDELETRMLGLAQMAALEPPKDDLFASVEDEALGPRIELEAVPVEVSGQ